MEVICEDWADRKGERNPIYNQDRIARIMGISRSQFAKALAENKNPTISFICAYTTAVGRPIDDLLEEIGARIMDEQVVIIPVFKPTQAAVQHSLTALQPV